LGYNNYDDDLYFHQNINKNALLRQKKENFYNNHYGLFFFGGFSRFLKRFYKDFYKNFYKDFYYKNFYKYFYSLNLKRGSYKSFNKNFNKFFNKLCYFNKNKNNYYFYRNFYKIHRKKKVNLEKNYRNLLNKEFYKIIYKKMKIRDYKLILPQIYIDILNLEKKKFKS